MHVCSSLFWAFLGLNNSLICIKDVHFGEGFISIFIEKSKADQLRQGQAVVIAETGFSICPVSLLKFTCKILIFRLIPMITFLDLFYLLLIPTASFQSISLYVIPPVESPLRNLFATLYQIFLNSVHSLQISWCDIGCELWGV